MTLGRPPRWALSRGKHLFDVVVAGCVFLLLAPVILALLALVRLCDGAPALFVQERCGRGGRLFPLRKLRTMRGSSGALITAAGDARVTRVGIWLRRLKLDELPQLVNVLAGDMSLVGPRPEVPAFAACHDSPWRSIRDMRPGITDWASLVLSDEEAILRDAPDPLVFYRDHLVPLKVALARLYRRRAGISTDLAILVATGLLPVIRRRRAVRLAGGGAIAEARARIEGALDHPRPGVRERDRVGRPC